MTSDSGDDMPALEPSEDDTPELEPSEDDMSALEPLPLDVQYAALRGLMQCPERLRLLRARSRAIVWRTEQDEGIHCRGICCRQRRAILTSSPLPIELLTEPLPWAAENSFLGHAPALGLDAISLFDEELCLQILERYPYDLSGVQLADIWTGALGAHMLRAGLDYGKGGATSAWEKLLHDQFGSPIVAAKVLELDPLAAEAAPACQRGTRGRRDDRATKIPGSAPRIAALGILRAWPSEGMGGRGRPGSKRQMSWGHFSN